MTPQLLFVDTCPEAPGYIRIAVTRDGGIPRSWGSLDPAIALIQVRVFVADMEDADGVIHSIDLPPAFLDALEDSST